MHPDGVAVVVGLSGGNPFVFKHPDEGPLWVGLRLGALRSEAGIQCLTQAAPQTWAGLGDLLGSEYQAFIMPREVSPIAFAISATCPMEHWSSDSEIR